MKQTYEQVIEAASQDGVRFPAAARYAFPLAFEVRGHSGTVWHASFPGMTLREYVAAHCMASMRVASGEAAHPIALARVAVADADALLAALSEPT